VRAVRGYRFPEAVAWIHELAEALPGDSVWETFAQQATPSPPSSQALEVYNQLFQMSAPPDRQSLAGRYLVEQRGLDLDLVAAHGVRVLVGWSYAAIDSETLRVAGLLNRNNRYLFAGHPLLLFFMEGDRPVYVVARDITGTARAKELSPAGVQCPVPYNVNALAGGSSGLDEVFVCEGPIDTLSAVQLGYRAIGVPGTTGFRDHWVDLLRGVRQVHVSFDNDRSGQRQGAELRARLQAHGIRADVVRPNHGNDINDLLRFQQGAYHE